MAVPPAAAHTETVHAGALKITDVSGPTLPVGASFMARCVDIDHAVSPGNSASTFCTGTNAYSVQQVGVSGGDIAARDLTTVFATVPEPETYAMLLAGLALMGFVARRRRHMGS